MLEISEEDYRELQRIAKLRKAGVISKSHLRKLTDETLAPFRKEQELRREKDEQRKERAQLRNEFRKKLRDIDSVYGKRRGSFAVQGGLPSLGKRK
jgi:hypothetical protein